MAEELYVVPGRDDYPSVDGDSDGAEHEAKVALLGAIKQLAARANTANALQPLVYAYAMVVGARTGSFPTAPTAPPISPATPP